MLYRLSYCGKRCAAPGRFARQSYTKKSDRANTPKIIPRKKSSGKQAEAWAASEYYEISEDTEGSESLAGDGKLMRAGNMLQNIKKGFSAIQGIFIGKTLARIKING